MIDYKNECINKDYIGVIKQVDNSFVYDKITIHQDYALIKLLEEMVEDKRFTILDMQDVFRTFYPEDEYKTSYYSYLCPIEYRSAYIGPASYPSLFTKEEYEEKVSKKLEDLEQKYLHEETTQNGLALFKQLELKEWYDNLLNSVNKKIEDELHEFHKSYKRHFIFIRFILAANYFNTLKSVKDESIKMISTDQIGWKKYTFPFFPDMTISVRSNFGYGVSSYFHCNVKYKDVNILPYTAIVSYYHVKMNDFVRCTRSYEPKRASWEDVFNFVSETTNMAYTSQEEFINIWIVTELEKMMKGIREINKYPLDYIEFCIANEEKDITGLYHIARNIGWEDKWEYEILPEEKALAIRAEKNTGCLYLLDDLRKLSELDDRINEFIAEIECMNKDLLPIIETRIGKINDEILKLQKDINEKNYDISIIEKKMSLDHELIIVLRKKMNSADIFSKKKYSFKDAETKYINDHKYDSSFTYEKNKNRIIEIKNSIEKINKHIRLREGFIWQLEECTECIKKYIKSA